MAEHKREVSTIALIPVETTDDRYDTDESPIRIVVDSKHIGFDALPHVHTGQQE
jgi:hypothetical protein